MGSGAAARALRAGRNGSCANAIAAGPRPAMWPSQSCRWYASLTLAVLQDRVCLSEAITRGPAESRRSKVAAGCVRVCLCVTVLGILQFCCLTCGNNVQMRFSGDGRQIL